MTIGDKIRTLYQHSATGTIVAKIPLRDWFIVQFDDSGARLCIHRDMLAVRNEVSA